MGREEANEQKTPVADNGGPKKSSVWAANTRSSAIYNAQAPKSLPPTVSTQGLRTTKSNMTVKKVVKARGTDSKQKRNTQPPPSGYRTHSTDRAQIRKSATRTQNTPAHTRAGVNVKKGLSAGGKLNSGPQGATQSSSRPPPVSNRTGVSSGKTNVADKSESSWSNILKTPARSVSSVKGVNNAAQGSSGAVGAARKPAVPTWPSLAHGSSSGASHANRVTIANQPTKHTQSQGKTQPKAAPKRAPKIGEGHAVSLFDLVNIKPARISSRAKQSATTNSQGPTSTWGYTKGTTTDVGGDKKGKRTATANPLDSTASVRRRGKERLTAKKKRPTAMRKIVQIDRENRRKLRAAAVLSATLEALEKAGADKQNLASVESKGLDLALVGEFLRAKEQSEADVGVSDAVATGGGVIEDVEESKNATKDMDSELQSTSADIAGSISHTESDDTVQTTCAVNENDTSDTKSTQRQQTTPENNSEASDSKDEQPTTPTPAPNGSTTTHGQKPSPEHSFVFSATSREFVPGGPVRSQIEQASPTHKQDITEKLVQPTKTALMQTPSTPAQPLLSYRSILSGAKPVPLLPTTAPKESAGAEHADTRTRTKTPSQPAKRKEKKSAKTSATEAVVGDKDANRTQPGERVSHTNKSAKDTSSTPNLKNTLEHTALDQATVCETRKSSDKATAPSVSDRKSSTIITPNTSKPEGSSKTAHATPAGGMKDAKGDASAKDNASTKVNNNNNNKKKKNKKKGEAGKNGAATHFHLSQSELIAARVADYDFFNRTVTMENTCRYNAIGSTHSAKFRGYCRNRVSKELLATTEQLTREIALLHHNKLKKDEAKANYRKRYAKGIREVQKALKTGVVKCIILPTDVENVRTDNGLNDQLRMLIDSCAEKEIQVVCAMTRKSLGDCLIPKAPVSVVSIHDYGGAHVAYKALHKELEEQQREYTHLINVHAKTCDTKCEARAKLLRDKRTQHDGEVRESIHREDNVVIQPRQKHVYELSVTDAMLSDGQSDQLLEKNVDVTSIVSNGGHSELGNEGDVETSTPKQETGESGAGKRILRITCSFSTDNGDIRFGINRNQPTTSPSADSTRDADQVLSKNTPEADVVVVEAKRVASDTARCTFDWVVEGVGVYVLEWDNGYSRSKSKVLHYTIEKSWSKS